jgi:hypothetical protein
MHRYSVLNMDYDSTNKIQPIIGVLKFKVKVNIRLKFKLIQSELSRIP